MSDFVPIKPFLGWLKSKTTSILSSINTSLLNKGGTAVTKLSDVPSAIDSIETGGGDDLFKCVRSVDFYNIKNLPEIVRLELNQVESLYHCLSGSNVKEAYLYNLSNVTSLNSGFANMTDVTYIKLDGLSDKVTDFASAFMNSSKLVTIDAEFDMTNVTRADGFTGLNYLENIKIKENSLSVNIRFNSSNRLNAESLVSIANSLVSGGHTLTLHTNIKTTCNNIFGTVDNSKGYSVFVPSDSGTTSLTEFITTEKGWTIA